MGVYTPLPPSRHLPRPGKPAVEPITFPLGEHLVVECEGKLSCRKCGGMASLEEADKFAETPCTTSKQQITSQPEQKLGKPLKELCDVCRVGGGREKTPILDPTTGQINQKLLCGNCFKDYLKILRFSGPRFGRVKARAPPNGVWFSYGENNNILFTQISGVWPCPACDEFYENLYDVVTHFAAKHTEIANKPNEKVSGNIDGKTVETLRTAQGYLICSCGFVAENDKHLAKHYINRHRETV
jgi:hypothetical protein